MKPSESAADWIEKLNLAPLPEEGGWFRETWKSSLFFSEAALPAQFRGQRAAATLIHYLLKAGEFSALHRLKADEIWLFHAGGPLRIEIFHEGKYRQVNLGPKGGSLQAVVPAGAAFGAFPAEGADFCLVSCVVSPGFEFQDFELVGRDEMQEAFPEAEAHWSPLFRN